MFLQMKRRTILIAALMALTGARAFGQPLPTGEGWSMDACIRYAVAHSTAVERRMVEENSARTDVQTALSDFLPSVGAGVNGQYSWGRNVDPETNTYNTITTFNNYYNIYANLLLFDGGQAVNRFRQAKLLRRKGLTAVQQAGDDKALEVMQKFVDAVYAQGCVDLATEKLEESRRLLHKTRRMEELGIKSLPDLAQIEAQVAEDDYNLTHGENQLRTAMLALKSAMNYPISDSLALEYAAAESILIGASEGEGRAEHIFSFAALNNPLAVAAEMSVRSAEFDHNIAKGRLLPSLSFSAGVGTSYYRNLSGAGPASPFHAQFWDNMGEYVSASMTLPLFDFARFKNVRKARNNVRLAELERDETMRKLHDDIEQAVADLDGYGKEVVKMEGKVRSDSLAYHLSSRKYEEGMLSTFDLHTASNTLLEARVRLLQMRMMYVIKQKLVGYYKGERLWM